MIRGAIGALLAFMIAMPASADGFQVVTDRYTFIELIKDRQLKRFGIALTVMPDGDIRGSAFGTPVTGAWRWDGQYFCRDLFYGDRDLGPNCQLVQRRGETLRFIADQGRGQYADLRLD